MLLERKLYRLYIGHLALFIGQSVPYKRNGTTTLFAALNILDGKVVGECHTRHRHQEWLRFLRRLDREFPSRLKLHLVMDNYGTHKEPHTN